VRRLYWQEVAFSAWNCLWNRRGCRRTRIAIPIKDQGSKRVEEVKQFPAIERRRNASVSYEQREAGEVAIFQELGKALTSSLQLDQVLRTIMEKIDEFLQKIIKKVNIK